MRGDTQSEKGMQDVTGEREPIFLPSKNLTLRGTTAQLQTCNILLFQGTEEAKNQSPSLVNSKVTMTSVGRTVSQSV